MSKIKFTLNQGHDTEDWANYDAAAEEEEVLNIFLDIRTILRQNSILLKTLFNLVFSFSRYLSSGGKRGGQQP